MTISDIQTIGHHIIQRHAPDLAGDKIPIDYDLVANGVIDSLSLLEVVEWVQSTWGISVLDTEISQEDFRTIAGIAGFIARTGATANLN